MSRSYSFSQPRNPNWFTESVQAWNEVQQLPSGDLYPFEHPENLTQYYGLHQNDYLRLSECQEVLEAKRSAMDMENGTQLASTVYSGNNQFHSALKQSLAKSFRSEDVILCSSGWAANVGLIEAIAKTDRPIYLDQKAHSSMWDGARLSNGRPIMIRHNDPAYLERRIRRDGPGLVCIDSFYSTNGAVADVKAYVEICERHDCVLLLDEAHSFGMIGEHAGGLAVEAGVAERVHFRTTSFSKALGGHGGAIACSRQLAWWLTHCARSVVFSSGVQPCDSAAHLAALRVASTHPELGRNCLERAAQLRNILLNSGIDTAPSACQIVSLSFPSGDLSALYYHALRRRGILASVFVYPAVPEGTGLVRLSCYSSLREEDVAYIGEAAVAAFDELSLSRKARAA